MSGMSMERMVARRGVAEGLNAMDAQGDGKGKKSCGSSKVVQSHLP